jgi:starvation-inducible DNA-binding protein
MAPAGVSATTAIDRVVTDLINLALLAKHAQWNLVGPTFRSMRQLLDELADLSRDQADDVAERALTLGHHPDGRAATVARDDSLPTIPAGELRDEVVITAFGSILDAVVSHIHEAIEVVTDDPVTRDLFTTIVGSVERHSWTIRSHRV